MRSLILVAGLLAHTATYAQIAGQMDERDPIIAATMVLTSAYMLERFEEFCADRHPRTETLVSEARQQWMMQHQALRDQAQQVYDTLLSAEQIRRLQTQWQTENDQIVERVSEALPAESFEFCTSVTSTFQAPEMMLTDQQQLVATLERFSP